MNFKDRYSNVFLTMTVTSLLSAYLFRNGKTNMAAFMLFLLVFAILYLAYLITNPAKLHLTKSQKDRLKPEYKGETDCKFSEKFTEEVDGIRIDGKRYKFVNGTDVCVNEHDELVLCGFGSNIMQILGKGGLEPESIQKDACWQ